MQDPKILIIAAVHGEEPQSAFVLERLIDAFVLRSDTCFKSYISQDQNILAIPRFNEYGLEHQTRGNKNKVDLNRNLPAQNWSKEFSDSAYYPGLEPASELETKEFVKIIDEFKPDMIISIHTNHFVTVEHPPQVNFDGEAHGQAYAWAQKLANLIDLEFTMDIGYSTPGSLGSYAKDLQIPCITLEFDNQLSDAESEKRYLSALKEFLFI